MEPAQESARKNQRPRTARIHGRQLGHDRETNMNIVKRNAAHVQQRQVLGGTSSLSVTGTASRRCSGSASQLATMISRPPVTSVAGERRISWSTPRDSPTIEEYVLRRAWPASGRAHARVFLDHGVHGDELGRHHDERKEVEPAHGRHEREVGDQHARQRRERRPPAGRRCRSASRRRPGSQARCPPPAGTATSCR